MIPAQNIVAWGTVVPWADPRQVEQDLIISRAIVALFEDPFLRTAVRFRGGTALNKLHFPTPLRYSEDIDLVRTTAGPIGPVLDALRAALQPWLGQAQYDPSIVAPKLRFRVEAEDGSGVPIRLKVETNISEIEAFDSPLDLPFAVDNPWFVGHTMVPTFSREEMLATKLRALLQRDKGRDLYDLAHALQTFDGSTPRKSSTCLGVMSGCRAMRSRGRSGRSVLAKLARPRFLTDMKPLLPAAQAELISDESTLLAFRRVFETFIEQLPGDPWVRADEMKDRFKLL
ncbi:nucleotidyl transferase AbiEii/AbiGii toxin family protein (plasmid) [Mesorhizobium sp. NBSH29]|uniref:nucleotidyl transferase AbiEii/AbiGii toxin family protein n=1 Tax=Mesorhizobium sp. NBSH29 TaxID=2654249 RepID=UPI00189685DA|nr:nucleotidyl transferase AbiEii/AbiGii toxin family protein [Mesorhizobium sp. NBSH29]QPC88864.1 nucleotidyl transferase AbiEii/AbiGii toxin family protein [Mesorhizobium sp. NBSH29]QPC89072.1 nucleotidyl transferase AbiEii/AbiGii toxin family protein [Mesorhizobium sp. NBSH29]